MSQSKTFLWMCLSLLCTLQFSATAVAQNYLDSINFGDQSSERDHGFQGDLSEIFKGAIDSPARRLKPQRSENWAGGQMLFKLKVDPEKQNYFTAKFWGGDVLEEESRLMLFADGMQIGQRHLGEVDPLDILASAPRYPGRFFYKTLPLPQSLTFGKQEVSLAIRVEGGIWGYGKEFDRFQQKLKSASRGIYRGYTHTDSFLTVDKSEQQGTAPSSYPIRPAPGPEVLDQTVARVNRHVKGLIEGENNAIGDKNIDVLSRACFIPWTVAYHNRDALNKLVRAIDEEFLKYSKDNDVFNEEWHGAGPTGGAIGILGKSLDRYLDYEIEGTGVKRRDAWTQMLLASRNYHVTHRRSYSNQAMTVDYNLYRVNRGIAVLNPKMAWPENKAIEILYEASGIKPWRGSYSEKLGQPEWPLGRNFTQTTEKGLSRELGYVGHYGELVVPIIRDMYAASRPSNGAEGDPKLKEQLLKVTKARAPFRYSIPDDDGYRSMRVETIIGWRDWHYPGVVTFDQMPCDDGCGGDAAATTMDPELIGYARQMLDENQFFSELVVQNNRKGVNVIKALMRAPENYQKLINYRGKLKPLPTTEGQPDFVFADSDTGAVALKHGDDILYTSLYWRARYGINNLARVHFMTPVNEYDSTVAINTGFKPSGMKFEIPDRVNQPFTSRFEEDYRKQGTDFAMAHQIYPIAAMPPFIKDFKPGKENLYAGKGTQYLMVYGQYCIAMNCEKKSITFDIPRDFIGAKVLTEGDEKEIKAKYRLKPLETLVLYKNSKS